MAEESWITNGIEAWDNRSHIDRINGLGNPAYVPGQGVVHTPADEPVLEPDEC